MSTQTPADLRVRARIGLACGVLFAVATAGAAAQLLPVDEAARQPDFFSFRARLQAAVAARDTPALLAAASRAIKLSFGGDDGVEALRRSVLQPDTAVWVQLGAVLALGGSFSGAHTFVAPYTFSRWPDTVDSFTHVALIASNVRLREAPRADAPVVSVRSFAILPLAPGAGGSPDAAWRAVKVSGNHVAYVSAALIRSPIGYRAYFQRRDGRWELTAFIAGD